MKINAIFEGASAVKVHPTNNRPGTYADNPDNVALGVGFLIMHFVRVWVARRMWCPAASLLYNTCSVLFQFTKKKRLFP